MPRGDKSAYTEKQKRKAEHIEEGYEQRGVSEKEAELLRYLVQNRGRAIARSELLQRVWGLGSGDLATRAIDMHIVNLREKLADSPDAPEVVLTVRGKGYMLGPGDVS